MKARLALPAALLVLGLVDRLPAQTSYPMLMALHPAAAQTGTTSEHTLKSRYSMYGAHDVLVSGEGVQGEIILPEAKEGEADKKPNLQEVKIRFTVAADAQPGVRDFRLATPQGASTLGQLVVVRDPVVGEEGKNNTPTDAQSIDVPAAVCGTIERAEDVDYFKFQAEAGTALTFQVWSMRLQDKIHDLQQHADPMLTLRNAAGQTLAASDNFFRGDPFLSYRFQQQGEYLLEIRDVRYQGNGYWHYCMEISDQPFVTNVFPLGVAAKQEPQQAELIGFQLPETPLGTILLKEAELGPRRLPLSIGEGQTNPVPVVVTDLPLVLETEGDNNSPSASQTVSLPAGINGRMAGESDVDCYLFEARKGERFSFEVLARRCQSRLDSHLRILDANGRQLALNDDLRLGKRNYADSWIENWTAPADGKYVIEIRDLHLRGGPAYVYFLRATRSQPYFELYLDTDKTQLTPGTSGVIYVRLVRKNGFQGEVQLQIEGLPEGVTADCGRILDGKGQDGCIVLHAVSDAPLAVHNARVTGTATFQQDDAEPLALEAVAQPYQEIYQPGGGRGHWPAGMHTVAVAAAADILGITLSETDVTLKPGESRKIDVKINRTEGFDKNVLLDVIFKHLNSVFGDSLPEGVTLDASQSKTLLTGSTSDGHLTLKAAANAPPVQQQLVPVMANVSINFVMKATYAAGPLRVTVEGVGEAAEK